MANTNNAEIVQSTNSKRAAFARPVSTFSGDPSADVDAQGGLTKREYAAIHILTGIMACPSISADSNGLAQAAVEAADELFRLLDAPAPKLITGFEQWPRDGQGRLICSKDHPMPYTSQEARAMRWAHEGASEQHDGGSDETRTMKCADCGFSWIEEVPQ